MKCFSLECHCLANEYDTHLLPLLRRMSNIRELTLNIINDSRTSFIDGTGIYNEILLHTPRLDQFIFHISSEIQLDHSLDPRPAKEDIQRTFTNIRCDQVECMVNYQYDSVLCRVFSQPFVFDTLEKLGNTFPPVVFRYVTSLSVHDIVPFEHEFFVRIAQSFPLLKSLCVVNLQPQSSLPNNNERHSVAEYRYLSSLRLFGCHTDYIEQFLTRTKTYLHALVKLTVDYDQLAIATDNFTRTTTRINCAQVEALRLNQTLACPQGFYLHFPLL